MEKKDLLTKAERETHFQCSYCGEFSLIDVDHEYSLLRKRLAESVAKECKCDTNTSVNHDVVNRNLKYKKQLAAIEKIVDEVINDHVGKFAWYKSTGAPFMKIKGILNNKQ